MTFQEAKEFLEDYIAQKRIAKRLMSEIAYLPTLNTSLTSTITQIRVQNGTPPSLMLEVRLKRKQEQLGRQIDKFLAMEDRLFTPINSLIPIQQDVIIGYYMQGKPHYKLAMECHYSTRQIINIKNAAIENIAKTLE